MYILCFLVHHFSYFPIRVPYSICYLVSLTLKYEKKKEWMCESVSRVWLFMTPWTVAGQVLCHGILGNPMGIQAGILKWDTISSFRGSSQLRDQTHISCVSCVGRWILYYWITWESPHIPLQLVILFIWISQGKFCVLIRTLTMV